MDGMNIEALRPTSDGKYSKKEVDVCLLSTVEVLLIHGALFTRGNVPLHTGHHTVEVESRVWGCDLSYDALKIGWSL
jgi:hypothetical protein